MDLRIAQDDSFVDVTGTAELVARRAATFSFITQPKPTRPEVAFHLELLAQNMENFKASP